MCKRSTRFSVSFFTAVLLIVGILLAPVATTLAQDDVTAAEFVEGDVIIVFDGPLNLRDDASLSATVVTVLSQDEYLEVLSGPFSSDGYFWYEVASTQHGVSGYVAADFVAQVTSGFSVGDMVIVVDGPVNVRSGAGLANSVISVMQEGEEATIVSGPYFADGYEWYSISGLVGAFVAGEFFGLSPDSPDGNLPLPIGSLVFVNTNLLNVRDAYGLDGAVINQVTNGDLGTVVDGAYPSDGYTWVKVAFGEGQNTFQGWVAAEFLSGGVTVGQTAIVADGPLNLRDDHDISGAVLDVLSSGDVVTVTDGPYYGAYVWFGVDHNGTSGYVAGRYLGATVAS